MERRGDLLRGYVGIKRHKGGEPHMVIRQPDRWVRPPKGIPLPLRRAVDLLRRWGKGRGPTGRLLRRMGYL